ncbi:MAG TPA: 5-formyltetrahydrofolate cyclo-ligase [Candidatus Saccharimonadales bacterium]|nr:5-formyltetrahydrofolate cyclo-ligase [Candidatus Saccharimonadales bacterium]
MNEKKATLRARLRQSRLALPSNVVAKNSRLISERLQGASGWAGIRKIHCYEPIKSLNEVDVTPFTAFLQSHYPEIQMYTSQKHKGTWQIVPTHAVNSSDGQNFEIIIVPMLGFDPQSLHRIGYGGGYYDRLLAGHPKARKIGVCFEQGKVKNLPTEAHDIPLDVIITEKAEYH